METSSKPAIFALVLLLSALFAFEVRAEDLLASPVKTSSIDASGNLSFELESGDKGKITCNPWNVPYFTSLYALRIDIAGRTDLQFRTKEIREIDPWTENPDDLQLNTLPGTATACSARLKAIQEKLGGRLYAMLNIVTDLGAKKFVFTYGPLREPAEAAPAPEGSTEAAAPAPAASAR